MRKTLSILCLIFLASTLLKASEGEVLRFNKDGNFKIVQLTDIHWNDADEKTSKETRSIIENVLRTENPDLAILTGDIVVENPIAEGWKSMAAILSDAKIPWTAVMGNHDGEHELSNAEIYEVLKNLPYFIGEAGNEALSGAGNYYLTVKESDSDKISQVIFCLDSHNIPHNVHHGSWDWIKHDQINWYVNTGNELAKANNGELYPALMFFHIPLREYIDLRVNGLGYGTVREGNGAATYNSGLFARFLEQGDVMASFVGHDHGNDYIGMEQSIALAYGRVSGTNAQGRLERGARIIQLYENQRYFDTWIRTNSGVSQKYYVPVGVSAEEEEAMTYLKPSPETLKGEQGLSYKYYEKKFKTVDNIEKEQAISAGILPNLSIDIAQRTDSFAFVFEGLIEIDERTVYQFYTHSDDGTKLYIDDVLVVDNDGGHSARRRNGKIALEKGLHRIKLLYFEDYMGEVLEVGMASKRMTETRIPNEILYQIK